MVYRKEVEIGGRIFSIETGLLAKQADAAVVAQYGETIVLATVVAAKEPVEDQDFFPLQVEYREKTAAAGKIPGGFIKREGRPTEKEILSARLIDRPIRPMFPENFRNETQIMVTVYSSDQEHDGDTIGAVAASAALMISDIPFDGPIAEVRVGRINGEFIIHPTFKQLEDSDLDITVAGTIDSIVMVEGEAKEVSEEVFLNSLKFAHQYIKQLCEMQIEFRKEIGKPKREIQVKTIDPELIEEVNKLFLPKIKELNRTVLSKDERSNRRSAIEEEIQTLLAERFPEQQKVISELMYELERQDMRQMILQEGRRLDGRGVKDIRPISIKIGILPRTHGSALFTRGETQSLTTTTLGTKTDEQILEGLLPETTKRFMLHYNFPPFSVGEIGKLGSVSRREIGHGNLAERSLKNLIPPESEFPYTIRVVSDILESNGSSSMATVCAGSLSLMDAGVPIKKAVAGIAMGLIKEENGIAILSDILGNEDHLGDMDFKVAGTADGITGLQMDIKVKGISFDIMAAALEQAREGRMHILKIMNEVISEPKKELSPYAPRLTSIKIPVDMIGAVIGPGGKTIKHIIKETETEINIEEDGTVMIAAVSGENSQKAIEMINKITELPEVGKTYKGKVTRVLDFGAFVEFLPGKEGLVHISHLDTTRVNKVTDVVKVGDVVEVKLINIDDEGRFNLSRKAVLFDNGQAGKDTDKPKQSDKKFQPDRHRDSKHHK
ncbi:MAG: Polyribonucleotide nucleotidyltransferase [Ignavibacteriae bacterium]|nr:MAG: Polyribonucleotide nucleotidyltransferase [Ignavibacteriota bacterium]